MATTLIVQCGIIIAVSLLGGWLPMRWGASHRVMQVALSFVAGTMFGLAMLDLLPEAVHAQQSTGDGHAMESITLWVIIGFLVIFLLERFVCFHHHDVPRADDPDHGHSHDHGVSWIAAGFGLSLHSVMAGVALAASVVVGDAEGQAIAGLAVLLAIVLHKPFDSMSLIALMTVAGHSRGARILANILFSLVTPAGVVIGVSLGATPDGPPPAWLGPALGFAVGMFLCVALSDLLPELQFHSHDRILLTVALLLGLGVAWFAMQFHDHGHAEPSGQREHNHDHDHDHHDHDHHGHEHGMELEIPPRGDPSGSSTMLTMASWQQVGIIMTCPPDGGRAMIEC